MPTLSNVLDVTFAAVNSCGDPATSGTSEASAGRNTAPKIGRADRERIDRDRSVRRLETRTAMPPVQREAAGVGGQHHALAAEPVGEGCGERRDRGRSRLSNSRDDADGGDASLVEGVDGDRHRERVVPDRRAGEGELDAAQVRVGEDAADRRERFRELAAGLVHRRTIASI